MRLTKEVQFSRRIFAACCMSAPSIPWMFGKRSSFAMRELSLLISTPLPSLYIAPTKN